MQLIFYYLIFVIGGDFVDYFIGLGVERIWPQASLLVFLMLYFASLWVAWLLAVRITAPKDVSVVAR